MIFKNIYNQIVLSSMTIVSIGMVTTSPARAFVSLFSGFGINGTGSLSPLFPSRPNVVFAHSDLLFLDQTSGAFVGSSLVSITNPAIFRFDSVAGPFNLYTLDPFEIKFSGVGADVGDETLTVNPMPGAFLRTGNFTVGSMVNIVPLVAKGTNDGENVGYFGNMGFTDTLSGDGVFSVSFTRFVPEPLTILGASTAITLGAAFKRHSRRG